ncbi:hypothetical protein QLX08_005614 [Tetragonisca angustula]|uniref:Transmembrane protein n=1 Tax=Tetragonisca angustula TaxID=166442 RepID=A0AAW0ZXM5_9HYME
MKMTNSLRDTRKSGSIGFSTVFNGRKKKKSLPNLILHDSQKFAKVRGPRSPPTKPNRKKPQPRREEGANVITGVVIVAIIVMVAGDRRHPANGRASNISPFNDSPDQQVVCFLNDTMGSRNRGNI